MTSLRIRRLFGLGGAGLVLAFAGAAAASALELPPVQPVPSVPVPTTPVPVPTVPVPTTPVPAPTVPLPVPTTPAPLPPTPSVPVSVPTPAVPSPIGATAPVTSPVTGAVSGATRAPGPTAGGGGGGTPTTGATGAGAQSGGGGPASPSTPFAPAAGTPAAAPASGVALPTAGAGAKHVATLRATTTRRRPGTVSVRFALPTRARVTVDVRGPLPSCNRTARFAVAGRRGANTLLFNGRVGRRRLVEGSYLLGLTPTGRRPAWVAVHVGPRGAQPLPRAIVGQALSQCSSTTATHALLALRLDSTDVGGTFSTSTAAASPTTNAPRATEPEAAGPAPASLPKAIVLPFEGVEEAISELPAGLGYFLLLLLAASLFSLVAYVVKFIRSPSAYRD